jgi:hypothetical protein
VEEERPKTRKVAEKQIEMVKEKQPRRLPFTTLKDTGF